MNVLQFSKSFAKHLEKELSSRTGFKFCCTAKGSSSHVRSNSCYVEICDLDVASLDYSLTTVKISDHFNKGYSDFNLDITGYQLCAELAKEKAQKCATEFMKDFEVIK